MIDQQQERERPEKSRRRSVEIAAFLAGLVATLAFFAFFPGLPHVIDWGAIVVSLLVAALARWACRRWAERGNRESPRP
ncbi:hypothetical protein J8N05_06420 [Streptomyces sp. BH-SS-21]|uniref:Uncharacterized protein n=1 Tax=Streptomyces liliiviolaceus TaxID=2823109 RepID=A0A940XPI1_9ACTN|nr:hypothetical protein [Streptomyces liliiviolaceus]MBQ0847846.1 hypothetical protein [Streptomyces liliiviolaceus]